MSEHFVDSLLYKMALKDYPNYFRGPNPMPCIAMNREGRGEKFITIIPQEIPIYLTPKEIFIHIPKNAGSSCNYALMYENCFGHVLACDFPRKTISRMRSIIRNPYDRLVSAYFFMKRGGFNLNTEYKTQVAIYPTFESWVLSNNFNEKLLTWSHKYLVYEPTMKQVEWLRDPRTKKMLLKPEQLGRYENLEEDFTRLFPGRPLLKCHINQSSDREKDWRQYYTNPLVREKVKRFYQEDFDLLGYDTEFKIPSIDKMDNIHLENSFIVNKNIKNIKDNISQALIRKRENTSEENVCYGPLPITHDQIDGWTQRVPDEVPNNLNPNYPIFVHIPRTAGISIKFSLYEINYFYHMFACNYPKKFRPLLRTIVRNPYDRIVSAYFSMREAKYVNNKQYRNMIYIYPTFEAWVLSHHLGKYLTTWNFTYHSFYPLIKQVEWLRDPKTKKMLLGPSQIGRFENLESDISKLLQREISIDFYDGKNNERNPDWRVYYQNPLVQKKIYNLYKEDFDILGYSPLIN